MVKLILESSSTLSITRTSLSKSFYDKIAIWCPQLKLLKKTNLLLTSVSLKFNTSFVLEKRSLSTYFILRLSNHWRTCRNGFRLWNITRKIRPPGKIEIKKSFPHNFFKDEISLVYRREFGKNLSERFFIDTFLNLSSEPI